METIEPLSFSKQETLMEQVINAISSDVRKDAIKKLIEQSILADNTKENNYLSTAIQKITNNQILADFAKSEDMKIALVAIARIEKWDQIVLNDIAKNAQFYNVRIQAIEKLEKRNDQNYLADIAKNDDSPHNRLVTVEKLTDQNVLTDIAKNDENGSVRIEALKKLTDRSILTLIAKKDKDYLVRQVAACKLNDQNIFADIAKNDDSPQNRLVAIEKLTDQNVLTDIAKNDINSIVRIDALKKLKDKSVLTQIAKKDKDNAVCKAAENRLTNISVLADNVKKEKINLKCKLGFHTWGNWGCKCTQCGKTRDHEHKYHDWRKDCEKCSECGKIRENKHTWREDCEKCMYCNKVLQNKHNWTENCEKCSNCYKFRENKHDWTKDCEKCSKCGKTRAIVHIIVNGYCSICVLQIEGTFIDNRDGHEYKWIKIGTQIIMKENLAFLFHSSNKSSYACVAYNDDNNNVKKYGYLYNWEAANYNVCPTGWHLPSEKEWQKLLDSIGYSSCIMKDTTGWIYHVKGRNATNKTGFSALPAGIAIGGFHHLGESALFWSSTLYGSERALCLCLDFDKSYTYFDHRYRYEGLSVRCFKD